MRTWARWLALGLVAVAVCPAPSSAYFLDKGRNFDVRLRAYTQLGMMAEDSEPNWSTEDSFPGSTYHAGTLAQHRNFYNPEFDAKLTGFVQSGTKGVPYIQGIVPDDLKFHFAWWGFYDGLYDYLDPVWNHNRQNLKSRWGQSDNPGWKGLTFQDENKNPRHIYASRNRINELYVDYTKGPLFVRLGRQAISWGESDDIALLDVQNPYDLTLGAPGFFQDVEEARIPLYTFRNTIKLVDNWKWLSSFFVDSYLVPGPIDTTVPIDPIAAQVSPFNPNQTDPQAMINRAGQGNLVHVSTVSRQPAQTWGNSRWGARLTGVVARDYTVQGWFFRTFNQAPVPILRGPPGAFDLGGAGEATLIDNRGFRVAECFDASGNPVAKAYGAAGKTAAGRDCSWSTPALTTLERRLESVVGLAATWYSPILNGIVRLEGEYFKDELGFVPEKNLNPKVQIPSAFNPPAGRNSLPTANVFRWLIGYDRFFFFRPLNPSNSFTWVNAFHGEWTINDNKNGNDFRFPLAKPGHSQTRIGRIPGVTGCSAPPYGPQCQTVDPHDFEQRYTVDSLFFQSTIQSDYLHGKLTPRLTAIVDVSGYYALAPSVLYRLNDSVLFSGTYLMIEGSRHAYLGTFQGHNMFQFRITYQLN